MATVAKVAVARAVDAEPIDRLEEKLKMLIGVIDRLRADNARAAEDNQRLSRELEGLRGRLGEAEGAAGELTALRDERQLVRARVNEMLQQIEALNL